MASDPRSSRPGDEGLARKAYHSPELRIFGDIRAITKKLTTGNSMDSGGMPGSCKTA